MRIKRLTDNKIQNILLIAVLLIGISLRFYKLDMQSLWFDELIIATISQFKHAKDVIIDWIISDVHPPLYFLFMYFWGKIVGTSETMLRLPSAIAGTITLFVVYFLTKRSFDKYIAVSVTILFALSAMA